MKIEEFNTTLESQVKDLLVELQNYVIKLDKQSLNIITTEYRDLYFNETYKQCYNNQGKIFLATENNKVLGMVCGYVETYNKVDKCVYACPKKGIISELIVSEKSRDLGLGDMLVKTIENYFKVINCEYCQLDVFAYNDNAIKFYTKHNYTNRMITMFKSL